MFKLLILLLLFCDGNIFRSYSRVHSVTADIPLRSGNSGKEGGVVSRRLSDERVILGVPPDEKDHTRHMKIWIVYSAYISVQRKYHMEIIKEQLESFQCNGLLQRADRIYVPISIDHASEIDKNSARLVKHAIRIVYSVAPNAIVSLTLENKYEYPGARKVWDLGQELRPETLEGKEAADKIAADTIIIYYHTKGMFNTYIPGFDGVRVPIDINYNHLTFDRWDTVLDMFYKNPELNKVGCAPADEGHVWFNFYYTRASYVQRLVNPTIHSNRYYYELWLGKLTDHAVDFWPKVEHIDFSERDVDRGYNSGCADCWSTCVPDNYTIGMHFKPDRLPHVNKLPWYKCRFNHTSTQSR